MKWSEVLRVKKIVDGQYDYWNRITGIKTSTRKNINNKCNMNKKKARKDGENRR